MIIGIVTGRIGSDAELEVHEGRPRLTFGIASRGPRRYGEAITTWIRCTMIGTRIEGLAKCLTSGTRVAVTGRMRTYLGPKGDARFAISVTELDLLGAGRRREHRDESSPEHDAPDTADD